MGGPGIIHDHTPDRQPVSFLGMDACMDNLTTEGSFKLQATWVIYVLGLFSDMLTMGVIQPGTGRCPVDWCRN